MPRKKAEESFAEREGNGSAVAATGSPKPKKKRKFFLRFVVFLIIVGLAGATAYYYRKYKKIKGNPNVVAQEEIQIAVNELSKLIELPEGTPSLATVQDKEKLKDQSFFKKAENGDKVLIYADAKQAILFRPSTKKIVEVAPLLMQNNENANENTPEQNVQSNNQPNEQTDSQTDGQSDENNNENPNE